MHRTRFWLAALLLLSWTSPAIAGNLRGQVTADGLPVAMVTVAAEGPNGLQVAARTDSLGLFDLGDLPAGAYALRAGDHPLFEGLTRQVEVEEDDDRYERLALLLLPGAPDPLVTFPLQISVYGVVTNLPLEGALVTVERFDNEALSGLPETTIYVADANGFIGAPGRQAGWYRFTVEHENWMTYQSEAALLEEAHMAVFGLEPEDISTSITVRGSHVLDGPFLESPGPLVGAIVEIEGLAPLEDRVLVPARSDRTDENGRVTFFDTPAIRWRVRAMKVGYEPVEMDLTGFGPGGFQGELTLPLDLSTAVDVAVTTPFASPCAGYVQLRGRAGTDVAGYFQEIPGECDDDNRLVAAFTPLLPGQYDVVVFPSTRGPRTPRFGRLRGGSVNAHGLVITRTLEVGTGERVALNLQAQQQLTRVTGRIVVADAPDSVSVVGAARALRQETEIELVPFDVGLYDPPLGTITVRTNALGEFDAQVPPAHYGVRIPALPDYTTNLMQRRIYEVANGRFSGTDFNNSGWIFPGDCETCDWHESVARPPTAFDSGAHNDLTMYLWRRANPVTVNIAGEVPVNVRGAIRVRTDAITVRLDGAPVPAADLEVTRDSVTLVSVPSGDHTISVSHPLWDVADASVTVPTYSGVGENPSYERPQPVRDGLSVDTTGTWAGPDTVVSPIPGCRVRTFLPDGPEIQGLEIDYGDAGVVTTPADIALGQASAPSPPVGWLLSQNAVYYEAPGFSPHCARNGHAGRGRYGRGALGRGAASGRAGPAVQQPGPPARAGGHHHR